jgi:hypothetical protein
MSLGRSLAGLEFVGRTGPLIAFDPVCDEQAFTCITRPQPADHNRISRLMRNAAATDYFLAARATGADKGSSGTPTQQLFLS